MPVTDGKAIQDISQREQYAKGGIGRFHWDKRDNITLDYITGNTIVDVGCGEGITLGKIIERFPDKDVRGLDSNPKNISICKSYNLPVIQGNVNELPFDDKSVDTCVFMEVIEHLEHPDKALKELSRVLRPNGRLIIVFPYDVNMLIARLLCLKWKEARFDPCHLKQWSQRELRQISPKFDLKPIASIGLPFHFPFALHGLYVAEKNK